MNNTMPYLEATSLAIRTKSNLRKWERLKKFAVYNRVSKELIDYFWETNEVKETLEAIRPIQKQ